MLTLISAQQYQYKLLDFAAERNGLPAWPKDAIAFGIVDKGTEELQASVVICDIRNTNCEFHIASNKRKRWATRSVLIPLFDAIFNGIEIKRIRAPISENNVSAICNALRLGFRVQGRVQEPDGNPDTIMLGMLAEQCPWLVHPEPGPANAEE